MEERNRNASTSLDCHPDIAFAEAMIGVEVYCSELDTSIAKRDSAAVEHIARNAVQVWLGGRCVCSQLMLVEHKQGRGITPYSDAARRHLEATYISLLQRFTHASEVITVPRMHDVLQELRATLITAAGEPLLQREQA